MSRQNRPANPLDIRRPRRCGMVLLLVVASLVLLAVIGTVYLLMARAQLEVAGYSASTVNLDFARQAVLNIAREEVLQETLDSQGNVLGGDTTGPGGLAARTWDYGEQNANPAYFNASNANLSVRSEPWLAAALPWEPSMRYAPGAEVVYNGGHYICNSQPAVGQPPGSGAWQKIVTPGAALYSELAPNLYDPATGAFDIPINGPGAPPVPDASVVEPNGNMDGLQPRVGSLDGIFNLLPYSSVSGVRYRYAVCITDTNSMANLNVGNVSGQTDPYGQYLTGLPITAASIFGGDTPGSLQRSPYPTAPGRQGISQINYSGVNYFPGWQSQALRFEKPTDYGIQWFDLSDELELRSYGGAGSGLLGFSANYICRPEELWPKTLAPESPYRNFFTTYSWDRTYCTVSLPLQKLYTLNGATQVDLGNLPDEAQLLWPYPRQINVNIPVQEPTGNNVVTDTGPEQVAITSTALATAMRGAGYQTYHAIALAANYAAYRFDGGQFDNGAYALPLGPSFVDGAGLCIRGSVSISNAQQPGQAPAGIFCKQHFGSPSDLRTYSSNPPGAGTTNPPPPANGQAAGPYPINPPPGPDAPFTPTASNSSNIIDAGFAAQPFINEVAVYAQASGGARPTLTFQNAAVELYNPFPVPLDLTGWKLKMFDATKGTYDPTVVAFPAGTAIPANGFVVVEANGTGLAVNRAANVVTISVQAPSALVLSTVADNRYVVLTRPFYPRGANVAADLPVDAFCYGTATTGFSTAIIKSVKPMPWSIQRINGPPATTAGGGNELANPWWCAVATEQTATPVNTPTLGAPNDAPGTVPEAIPLYDRFAESPLQLKGMPPVVAGSLLLNIADFNRITRLPSVCALAPNAAPGGGPDYVPVCMLSSSLATLTRNTVEPNVLLQYEARARFDFLAPPTGPVSPRASRILACITLVDRADNPRVDVGGGAVGLEKVRIPGRINVNTAPVAVLADLFSNEPPPPLPGEPVAPTLTPQQAVADTEAFRDRLAFVYQPPGGGGPYRANFAAGKLYPGVGITTMGQLLYAFTQGLPRAKNPPATLDARDADWAAIYNYSTVRSDTFVVYGYVEALRANTGPGAPANDNKYAWYTGSVTDDPNGGASSGGGQAQNIRLARQRFVAIVDRSFCNLGRGESGSAVGDINASFTLPRVVAIKLLPN